MKSRAPSKRRTAKQDNLPATSFEEQERQLALKRRELQQEIDRCKSIVAEAPKVKEQQKKQRQKEIEERRSKACTVPGARHNRIPDFRHPNEVSISAGRRLRRERSQGRLTFFMLLAALIVVLTWAYFTLSGPAH